MHIGFIGLGNMGGPMAHNLLSAGHALSVCDLCHAAVADLAKAGASAVTSPAALAGAEVDLIISMLPAAAQVRQVYLGDDGVLERIHPGALLIDCSTIDPHSARAVAAAAAERGNPMLDAPVSGGTLGAKAASLTFMVGGAAADFERARPILAAMGKNIVHCGEAGNGQAAKLANNMLAGISMIGVAEAMALGVALGVDAKLLAGVINTSSGRCWSSDSYNPYPGVIAEAPASHDYLGGFRAELMLKDLGLATQAAGQIGQPVLLGSLAQQLYMRFGLEGHGKLDFSAIIKAYLRDPPLG